MDLDTQDAYEKAHADVLRQRGVDDPCLKCRGYGWRLYSHGSTWRGGVGTCGFQHDVCDSCWGSGDRYRSGVDLRRLRDEESARVAERAVDLLAEAAGAKMQTARGAVTHIILHLQKLVDRRGAPAAPWLVEMTASLANHLRRAIGAPEARLR